MKSVFISSTFKDMQAERDLLHERIFPRLRGIIGEYGEDIQELDLRWGVDTTAMSEEESSHQVLRVCIDAIDRCHPYIVVLLGERYGWIPEPEVVESLRDERVNAWYEKQMSITNLEIQYGALSEEETLKSCIFCFRTPKLTEKIDEVHRALYASESPLHKARLDALKERIRAKEGAIIMEYEADWDAERGGVCGLEDFGEAVYARLEEMIQRDFAGQRVRDPNERLALQMERLSEQYLSVYLPRYQTEVLALFWLGLYNKEAPKGGRTEQIYRRTIIRGAAGSGKSALMASLERLVREAGCTTILYFAGHSGCQSLDVLKDFLIYRLEEICGLPHEAAVLKEERLRILAAETKERNVFCFIDGLDQLFGPESDGRLDILNLCPNFYYVLSVVSDYPVEGLIKGYVWTFQTEELEEFSASERRELIRRTAAKRGKKLDEELIRQMLQAPGAGNPLYLSMALQRFFMMDQKEFEAAEALAPGMEGLHRYMGRLLEEMPKQTGEMARYLLQVTGERFGLEWFWEILRLLAVSEYGLSERELAGVLSAGGMRFRQAEFQQLVSYLYDAFSLREDGKWVFAHRLFEEAVESRMTEEEREAALELLIRYSLEDGEFLEQEGFYYILRQRHEAGGRVLLQAEHWKTRQKVLDFVGQQAARDADSRAWLLELTAGMRADTLCGFWLSFQLENYEADFEEFLAALYKLLLEKPELSREQKCDCLLKLEEYYGDKSREKAFACLEQAETLCREMPQPLQSRRRAVILTRRAWRRKYFSRELEREAAKAEYELALADYEAAIELLKPLLLEEASGEYWEIVLEDVWNRIEYAEVSGEYAYDYRRTLLKECLEKLALCPESARKEEFLRAEATAYILLAKDYLVVGRYDIDQYVAYAQKALDLSKKLVGQNPSTGNLRLRLKILNNCVDCYRPEYRYPYADECLMVVRQLYERYPNRYWKAYLAYACCLFGEAVDRAVMGRDEVFSENLRRRAKQSHEEGFRLYGELEADGDGQYNSEYERFLRTKAETDEKQGYRREAVRKALKSKALLEKVSQGRVWKLRDVNLILARAYCEVCQTEKALPCAEEGLRMALSYQEQQGKPNEKTAQAWLVYARCLYYARRDGEALEACREAEAAYGSLKEEAAGKPESNGREAVYAELAYIRCRILLVQERLSEAREHWQRFADYCGGKEKSWEYGQNLILQGDILLAEGRQEEALAAFERADEFWKEQRGREEAYFSDKKKEEGYRVYKQEGVLRREIYRADSGFFMRAAYYRLYSLYKKRELAGQWEGSLSSILGDTYAAGEKCTLYVEWIWLPVNVPAFARLTAMIPEKVKEEWIAQTLEKNPPIHLEERLGRIAAMEGNVSASELLKQTERLYEQVRDSELEYRAISKIQEGLSERFQIEDGRIKETAFPSEEQKDLFMDKEAAALRVWYPLLELIGVVARYREQLSDRERVWLDMYSAHCFFLAGVLSEEYDREWRNLSALSKEALELALASQRDVFKNDNNVDIMALAGKNVCTLELYGRTGDEMYVMRRLEELTGLDAFIRNSIRRSKKNQQTDIAESTVEFMGLVLKQSGAGTAARLHDFLKEHDEIWRRCPLPRMQKLRDAFLTALRDSPEGQPPQEARRLSEEPMSSEERMRLREEIEDFWQEVYRRKWEAQVEWLS